MIRSAASAVGVNGFSQKTGLPAAIARDDGVDAVDVRLAHAAGADHADAYGHWCDSFVNRRAGAQRRPRPMEARYSRVWMALGSG